MLHAAPCGHACTHGGHRCRQTTHIVRGTSTVVPVGDGGCLGSLGGFNPQRQLRRRRRPPGMATKVARLRVRCLPLPVVIKLGGSGRQQRSSQQAGQPCSQQRDWRAARHVAAPASTWCSGVRVEGSSIVRWVPWSPYSVQQGPDSPDIRSTALGRQPSAPSTPLTAPKEYS